MSKKFDVVGFIIELESGVLDEESTIQGFQKLIDTGIVWSLQGSYQKAASQLIESGLCQRPVHHFTSRKDEKRQGRERKSRALIRQLKESGE